MNLLRPIRNELRPHQLFGSPLDSRWIALNDCIESIHLKQFATSHKHSKAISAISINTINRANNSSLLTLDINILRERERGRVFKSNQMCSRGVHLVKIWTIQIVGLFFGVLSSKGGDINRWNMIRTLIKNIVIFSSHSMTQIHIVWWSRLSIRCTELYRTTV